MTKEYSYSAGLALFYMPDRSEDPETFAKSFYEESKNKYRQKPHVLIVEQYGKSWSVPKGRKKDKENHVETAVRELYEEANVKLGQYTLFGNYEASMGYEYMLRPRKRFPSPDPYPLNEVAQRPSLGGKKVIKCIIMMGGIINVSLEDLDLRSNDKDITDVRLVTYKQSKKKLHKADFNAVWKLYRKGLWQYMSNRR
jgi:8-oxo-dGTP pyrophosphatase MutT (NUDIX family)